jgi:hypothetical protein
VPNPEEQSVRDQSDRPIHIAVGFQWLAAFSIQVLVATWSPVLFARPNGDYDPLEFARAQFSKLTNREAVIPVQCYTKTDGVSNPCWTCHTERNGENAMADWELQKRYSFSEEGKINHWSNLFVDRRAEIGRLPDAAVLAYVREDNYTPLAVALRARPDYQGWRLDLDLVKGFDELGFARDGSWWRAFRFKPFPGTFWPTNGSTDDIFIRLPAAFYSDNAGRHSLEIYKINLSILEAAMSVPSATPDSYLRRRVEPLNETLAGVDLNGDLIIHGLVEEIRGLPINYVGGAHSVKVQRHIYPAGTEFLHSVRYIDPDRPNLIATRMKELRYSVKRNHTSERMLTRAYSEERFHKSKGVLPQFLGGPDEGLLNDFGWRLQGFIENEQGRLRAQTKEETYYCMGCHGTIGVTADQTFGFPRKLPGRPGWGYQDLRGIKDVPQAGHVAPEVLTYFRRVGAGDEFRANEEILNRFFPEGVLDEEQVLRAAPQGDQDLAWLLAPSRQRALRLNAAYMTLVRHQSFAQGRDTLLTPPVRVHKVIDNVDTGLESGMGVFKDGDLLLSWP